MSGRGCAQGATAPAADAAQPRWSEDETAQLVAGFKDGVSPQALAAKIGRPELGVRQKIKRLRAEGVLSYGVKAEPKPGAPKATQAPRWSEAEDAEAVRLKLAGRSVREIAAAVGRPEPATQVRFKRHLRERLTVAATPATAARQMQEAPVTPKAQAATATVCAFPGCGREILASSKTGVCRDHMHKTGCRCAPCWGKVTPPPLAASVRPTGNVPSAPGPAVPAVAPPFEPGKPAWRRKIESYLDYIGHKAPWTAELDLALVEGLAKGVAKELLADQLGVEIGAIKARFIALTPDGPGIETQRNLLTVLRERAGGAA